MKPIYIVTIIFLILLNTFLLLQLAKCCTIKIDLPEEYSVASSKDTFIGIKKNDTLFIHFKKN
jgi:hypothetical protein